jgi:single-stranded DNA-binding protein
MTVSSVFVGVLADGPAREYTMDGAPVARFPLSCPVPPGMGRYVERGTEQVSVTVEASDELAELVLRELRAGDRLVVVGGLAVSQPDPGRHGATDLYVRASRIGLDVTSTGWHRDHTAGPPAVDAVRRTDVGARFHW